MTAALRALETPAQRGISIDNCFAPATALPVNRYDAQRAHVTKGHRGAFGMTHKPIIAWSRNNRLAADGSGRPPPRLEARFARGKAQIEKKVAMAPQRIGLHWTKELKPKLIPVHPPRNDNCGGVDHHKYASGKQDSLS